MRKECERIEAKRKIEVTLTQGQAVTLARNEQVIERLTEEIDDFEELLKDSIRESLLSRGEKVSCQFSARASQHFQQKGAFSCICQYIFHFQLAA